MPDNEEATIDQDLQATMDQIDKEVAEDPKPNETTPNIDEPKDEEGGEPREEAPKETPDDTKPTEEKPAEEDTESVDYKKRYSDSTREAAILAAKLKKQNEALEQAGEVTKPTEEDMVLSYPEWEEMSATEKRLAIDNEWNNKRFALIEGVSKETKNIEAWNTKVDEFIGDPKVLIANPQLEGKEEGFKAFCAKDTRRGVNFEDLVSSFLFTVESTRVKHKGQMMPTGTAGPNENPKQKSDKLSVEDSAKLMETDYTKWQEMLEAGKLANE